MPAPSHPAEAHQAENLSVAVSWDLTREVFAFLGGLGLEVVGSRGGGGGLGMGNGLRSWGGGLLIAASCG